MRALNLSRAVWARLSLISALCLWPLLRLFRRQLELRKRRLRPLRLQRRA